MSNALVSRNDDIRRLVEKGYAIAFDSNQYLVVRDIPYLDAGLEVRTGAIVSKFIDHGGDRITPHDHQVFFAGSHPYGLDGKPIPNLGGGTTGLALSDASKDVVVERSFSNKPKENGEFRAFRDFFEKIESYVNIVAGPAIQRHRANPFTFRQVESGPADSPFKFRDTLTSRAEIGDLAAKFKDDVVAVIGLGGTGAYLLEYLVKTPVREIRAFDFDYFHVHTAFRSPGRLEPSEFGKTKAEVYQSRYENFRAGLRITCKFIDSACADDLKGVTFAFVCVDKGSSRAGIFDLLIELKIPFIDVGMGLDRRRGPIDGTVRTTYYSAGRAEELRDQRLADLADDPDDIYRATIQLGELNALNAALAVIRFKQIRGFYFYDEGFHQVLFRVSDLKVLGDVADHDH